MITLHDITFRYADKLVLDRFSAQFPLRGVTALTGPSGCGKTTLLRLLAGLERPLDGYVEGIRAEETAFLFQENRLLPKRPAAKQITDVLPRERRGEAGKWLAFAELEGEENTLPQSLSGGMARRLALARCAALGGKLLLLDEPFAGVDPQRAQRILRRLKKLEGAVLLVSHEPAVLEGCDRLIALDGPPLYLK